MLQQFLWGAFVYDRTIYVQQGDTLARFIQPMSSRQANKLKLYAKQNNIDLTSLAVGKYTFSGSLTPKEFFAIIQAWPQSEYIKYTVLEWWSSYDIDADLAKKGYTQAWEFLEYIDAYLPQATEIYDFLQKEDWSYVQHLEGFLYPNTYFLDVDKDVSAQLVTHHLQTYKTTVDSQIQREYKEFLSKLQRAWYSFELSPYQILILASIIEKEERNDANKPDIAWVFLNRIQNDMRIDADITLCYGLETGYEACTPQSILENLYDTNNIYNTRQRKWLTPRPIANPDKTSIDAVLNFEAHSYFYYLHDANGNIHMWKDLQEHNFNKSKYIQ